MDSLIPVLMIFIGIVVGGAVAWLVLHRQSQQSYEKGQADNATQVAALQERMAARDQEVQKLQQAFDREVSERDRLRDSNAELKAHLEGERRAAQERSESFKQAAEELSEKFKALSRDALKDNNQSFLELARSTLAQE